MKIVDINSVPVYPGFDITTSTVLQYNNIDPKDFLKTFPDVNKVFKDYGLIGFINYQMKSLKLAGDFINKINEYHGKKFCVIGDYDADGIFGTLIMVLGLREIGEDCDFVIPNRLESGYGMKNTEIDIAIEKGAEVIITVDNGIGCKDAVSYALSNGLDVIITDHHVPGENVPEGVLIIDPLYNGDDFPHICGAYVAFKLIADLLASKNVDIFKLAEYAVFVGIATVADMMPLIKENRLLLGYVFKYIDILKERKNWGNRVLKVVDGLGGRQYIKNPDAIANEDLFGFYIGPSVNAISRVYGDPTELVESIIDCNKQGVYLTKFWEINKERRENTKILHKYHIKNSDAVNIDVFMDSEFEFPIAGLLGLVANKISDKESKPALVGHEKDGLLEFSCRSIPGYPIYDAFLRIKEKHPELCLSGGGHAAAMGLRFPSSEENLEVFRNALNKDFKTNAQKYDKTVFSFYNNQLDEIVNSLSKLRIFGTGIKAPEFIYKGIFTEYDHDERMASIGNLKFKMYLSKDREPSNKEETIIFRVLFDSKSGPYLKAKFVDIDEEEVLEDDEV